MLEQSILKTTKQLVGLPDEYEAFDLDIITHINSAFATLHQLGVGPDRPFSIEDKTSKWEEFLELRPNLESVRSYMGLYVRVRFDPPQNSATLTAFNETLKEYEFRLMVAAEEGRKLP